MNYKTIVTIKESEKVTVELASVDMFVGPVIVKRLKGGKSDVYRLLFMKNNCHIPRIYAIEEQEEELLVAEEYIGGENLEELLQTKAFSDEQKLNYALQLCEAVGFLHTMEPPVIHKDIKLSNILINKKDELKLIDFDASRIYKNESNSGDTILLGTVEYAPPEQYGYAQTDVRSDIYSMGVVFNKMGFMEDKQRSVAWERIVEKCTRFDPKNRYQSVQELTEEIRKLQKQKESRWKKALVGCGIGAVVLILVLTIAFGIQNRQVKETGGDLIRQTYSPAPTEAEIPTPTRKATMTPTPSPMPTPTPEPTLSPTYTPTPSPTYTPTSEPTSMVTATPTPEVGVIPTKINQEYYTSVVEDTELIIIHGCDSGLQRWEAECFDYATGNIYYISQEQVEIGEQHIRFLDEGLKQLHPSVYNLTLYLYYENGRRVSPSRVLKVYEDTEYPRYRTNPMAANEEEDFSCTYPENFNWNVYSYATSRVFGAWIEMDGVVEKTKITPEWYEVLWDGKLISIKKEFLLMYYKEGCQIKLTIDFDDGKEQTIILNCKEDL